MMYLHHLTYFIFYILRNKSRTCEDKCNNQLPTDVSSEDEHNCTTYYFVYHILTILSKNRLQSLLNCCKKNKIKKQMLNNNKNLSKERFCQNKEVSWKIGVSKILRILNIYKIRGAEALFWWKVSAEMSDTITG